MSSDTPIFLCRHECHEHLFLSLLSPSQFSVFYSSSLLSAARVLYTGEDFSPLLKLSPPSSSRLAATPSLLPLFLKVELAGTSYSLPQRIGAIMRNGIKLFVIGTAASLIGTGMTDALIIIRKVLDKDYAGAAGDIPILQTSVGYGVYMAVSSNLRYQLLAGVVEQRILEPVLCENKLMLPLVSFAFRTGNTFLGSLMWVDYARLIGIQEICG